MDKATGLRAEVFHGNARHTSGCLTRNDLKMNTRGAIISIRASNRATKEKRLEKAGYKTKKENLNCLSN